MRTTVTISDDVLRRARQRAASKGVTVSAVIEQALLESLAEQGRAPSPSIVVFRDGDGAVDGVDLTSNAALQELLDDDLEVDRRR